MGNDCFEQPVLLGLALIALIMYNSYLYAQILPLTVTCIVKSLLQDISGEAYVGITTLRTTRSRLAKQLGNPRPHKNKDCS